MAGIHVTQNDLLTSVGNVDFLFNASTGSYEINTNVSFGIEAGDNLVSSLNPSTGNTVLDVTVSGQDRSILFNDNGNIGSSIGVSLIGSTVLSIGENTITNNTTQSYVVGINIAGAASTIDDVDLSFISSVNGSVNRTSGGIVADFGSSVDGLTRSVFLGESATVVDDNQNRELSFIASTGGTIQRDLLTSLVLQNGSGTIENLETSIALIGDNSDVSDVTRSLVLSSNAQDIDRSIVLGESTNPIVGGSSSQYNIMSIKFNVAGNEIGGKHNVILGNAPTLNFGTETNFITNSLQLIGEDATGSFIGGADQALVQNIQDVLLLGSSNINGLRNGIINGESNRIGAKDISSSVTNVNDTGSNVIVTVDGSTSTLGILQNSYFDYGTRTDKVQEPESVTYDSSADEYDLVFGEFFNISDISPTLYLYRSEFSSTDSNHIIIGRDNRIYTEFQETDDRIFIFGRNNVVDFDDLSEKEASESIGSKFMVGFSLRSSLKNNTFTTILGEWNDPFDDGPNDNNRLLIVGNGDSENSRSNTLVLTKDGLLQIDSLKLNEVPSSTSNTTQTLVRNPSTGEVEFVSGGLLAEASGSTGEIQFANVINPSTGKTVFDSDPDFTFDSSTNSIKSTSGSLNVGGVEVDSGISGDSNLFAASIGVIEDWAEITSSLFLVGAAPGAANGIIGRSVVVGVIEQSNFGEIENSFVSGTPNNDNQNIRDTFITGSPTFQSSPSQGNFITGNVTVENVTNSFVAGDGTTNLGMISSFATGSSGSKGGDYSFVTGDGNSFADESFVIARSGSSIRFTSSSIINSSATVESSDSGLYINGNLILQSSFSTVSQVGGYVGSLESSTVFGRRNDVGVRVVEDQNYTYDNSNDIITITPGDEYTFTEFNGFDSVIFKLNGVRYDISNVDLNSSTGNLEITFDDSPDPNPSTSSDLVFFDSQNSSIDNFNDVIIGGRNYVYSNFQTAPRISDSFIIGISNVAEFNTSEFVSSKYAFGENLDISFGGEDTNIFLGEFNVKPTPSETAASGYNRVLTIGNGTNDNNRANALEVVSGGSVDILTALKLKDVSSGSNTSKVLTLNDTTDEVEFTDISNVTAGVEAGNGLSSSVNPSTGQTVLNVDINSDDVESNFVLQDASTGNLVTLDDGANLSAKYEGSGSFTIGYRSGSVGTRSLVIGGASSGANEASDSDTVIIGSYNTTTAQLSTVIGGGNSSAFGNTNSHAISMILGFANETTGSPFTTNTTFMFGRGLQSSEGENVYLGRFNLDISDTVFAVGDGANDSSRENAFYLRRGGSTVVNDEYTTYVGNIVTKINPSSNSDPIENGSAIRNSIAFGDSNDFSGIGSNQIFSSIIQESAFQSGNGYVSSIFWASNVDSTNGGISDSFFWSSGLTNDQVVDTSDNLFFIQVPDLSDVSSNGPLTTNNIFRVGSNAIVAYTTSTVENTLIFGDGTVDRDPDTGTFLNVAENSVSIKGDVRGSNAVAILGEARTNSLAIGSGSVADNESIAIGDNATSSTTNEIVIGGSGGTTIVNDLSISGAGQGVVVTTPDGLNTYRIAVDNNGNVTSEQI